jgi:hypothetical protein
MTPGTQYRKWAAELHAKADKEYDPNIRAEWRYLARGYLRLAAQADQSGRADIRCEPFLRLGDLDGELA